MPFATMVSLRPSVWICLAVAGGSVNRSRTGRLFLASVAEVVVRHAGAPAARATHPEGEILLTVDKKGQGTVSGSGISCGSDCVERFVLDEDCVYVGSGGNHNDGRVQCDAV